MEVGDGGGGHCMMSDIISVSCTYKVESSIRGHIGSRQLVQHPSPSHCEVSKADVDVTHEYKMLCRLCLISDGYSKLSSPFQRLIFLVKNKR